MIEKNNQTSIDELDDFPNNLFPFYIQFMAQIVEVSEGFVEGFGDGQDQWIRNGTKWEKVELQSGGRPAMDRTSSVGDSVKYFVMASKPPRSPNMLIKSHSHP